MKRQMLWNAVSTVIRGRVKQISQGKVEVYEVGDELSNIILVRLTTENGITKVVSCTCRHHSVKDIYKLGYCSSVLAVFLWKMIPIWNRLKGEMLP